MCRQCIHGQCLPCTTCPKFHDDGDGIRFCHFTAGTSEIEETYSCDLCGAPIDEYTYFHNNELCHECSDN